MQSAPRGRRGACPANEGSGIRGRLAPSEIQARWPFPSTSNQTARCGLRALCPRRATGVTRNRLPLALVPEGAVTRIGPLVAPLGTVAVICVAELTAKEAEVPLKATAVAPVKFAPVIITFVPTGPPVGVKELSVGAAVGTVTVKLVELLAVPPGVVTLS